MKLKISLFFLHEFFGSLDFARGLFVVFLMSKGLSLGEVGILQTLLFWSNIVFEVPAGILADRLKRKYSIALGLGIISLVAFLMPHANSFIDYASLFILHGMGFAFRSGADQALLFDELQIEGPEWAEKYLKLSARSKSLVNLALVLAMAAGGFLQGIGWHAVYTLFGSCMLMAMFFVLAISERPHKALKKEISSSTESGFKTLLNFSRTQEGRMLTLFVLGMGFFEATHAPFFIYSQSYLKQEGLSESLISIVIAASLALTSVGYLFVDKLSTIKFSKLVINKALLLALLISIFLFHPNVIVGILLFAVIDMIPSLLFVHSDNYINEKLPSSIRASLLSCQSLISSVFISIAFLAAGRMLDFFAAWKVLGLLFLLPLCGALLLSVYFKKRAVIHLEASHV
jgi:MFS family permease